MTTPSIIQLCLFAVAWAISIYAVNCLVAGKIKKVAVKPALLHVSTMALLGLIGEVAIGSFYEHVFHGPLWNYTVFPIHHAYTSQYAVFLWGIYGFHLYLLHDTFKERGVESIHRLAGIFCLEAIAIEALVNLTYRFSFGQYIYYYYPADLWHLTSVQTLPFYLLAGYIIIHTFRKFEVDTTFYTMMSVGLVSVLAFMT